MRGLLFFLSVVSGIIICTAVPFMYQAIDKIVCPQQDWDNCSCNDGCVEHLHGIAVIGQRKYDCCKIKGCQKDSDSNCKDSLDFFHGSSFLE